MVRIAVISDTHGSEAALMNCQKKCGSVGGFFHLGDFASDARLIERLTGKPVYSVLGNCDGFGASGFAEDVFPEKQKALVGERVVTIEGVRILLCHGHRFDVDISLSQLDSEAVELGCSAALYGHTHRSELSAFGKVLKLNPGSPSRPRYGSKPSFAILTVDKGQADASIIVL